MNRRWVIAGALALLFHALLLFGFRMETAAVPLPSADTAVDVSLVAAVSPPATKAPPPPEPPADQPPPPPEPAPPPPPPPLVPETTPVAEATPIPREHPLPRERVRPAQTNPAAPKVAGPTQTAPAPAGTRMGATSAVRPRYNPKPDYPPEADRLGQRGMVLLEVQVGADGRVTGVSVKRSSGFPILDNAAVKGIQRWVFEPARVAGLPVASRADVPVKFGPPQ